MLGIVDTPRAQLRVNSPKLLIAIYINSLGEDMRHEIQALTVISDHLGFCLL
jgi:hypothetical protein